MAFTLSELIEALEARGVSPSAAARATGWYPDKYSSPTPALRLYCTVNQKIDVLEAAKQLDEARG